MKVVIMCAGKGSRWGKETPKELALINGIPNTVRTIQMLGDLEVTISTSESKIHHYTSYKTILGSDAREIDRFRNLFGVLKRGTVILYGDCLYHKDDLAKILIPRKENTFFGRSGKNTLTGKPYGEIFGIYVAHPQQFIENVNTVATLFEQGKIKREIGWEVLKVQAGIDPNLPVVPKEHLVELSNYTDDFDTPHEYEVMIKNCL